MVKWIFIVLALLVGAWVIAINLGLSDSITSLDPTTGNSITGTPETNQRVSGNAVPPESTSPAIDISPTNPSSTPLVNSGPNLYFISEPRDPAAGTPGEQGPMLPAAYSGGSNVDPVAASAADETLAAGGPLGVDPGDYDIGAPGVAPESYDSGMPIYSPEYGAAPATGVAPEGIEPQEPGRAPESGETAVVQTPE